MADEKPGPLTNITMKIAGSATRAVFGSGLARAVHTGNDDQRSVGERGGDTIREIYGFGPKDRSKQSSDGVNKTPDKDKSDPVTQTVEGARRGAMAGVIGELVSIKAVVNEIAATTNIMNKKFDRMITIMGEMSYSLSEMKERSKQPTPSGGSRGADSAPNGSGVGSLLGGIGNAIKSLFGGGAAAEAAAGVAGAAKGSAFSEAELKALKGKGYVPRGNGFVNQAGKFVSRAEVEGALAKGSGKAAGLLGGAGKILGKAALPLGGIISAGETYHETGSIAQSAGAGLGTMGGALAGAEAGAGVGALFGGVGAIPGAIIGGVAGGLGGEWIGKKAGSMLDRKPGASPVGDGGSIGTINIQAGTVNVVESTAAAVTPSAPANSAAPPASMSPSVPARAANPTHKSPVAPVITPRASNRQLGYISGKFESGNNAGRVSTGKGDPGGVSYGTHQLSSKAGTLQKFLKESGYDSQFAGLEPGTPAFNAKWKELAATDENFGLAQHNFIKKTHYDPAEADAAKLGVNMSDPRFQEAVFSMSVQHSRRGVDTILQNAVGGDWKSLSAEEQLQRIYESRAAYAYQSLNTAKGRTQIKGVLNRYRQELHDIKNMRPAQGVDENLMHPQIDASILRATGADDTNINGKKLLNAGPTINNIIVSAPTTVNNNNNTNVVQGGNNVKHSTHIPPVDPPNLFKTVFGF